MRSQRFMSRLPRSLANLLRMYRLCQVLFSFPTRLGFRWSLLPFQVLLGALVLSGVAGCAPSARVPAATVWALPCYDRLTYHDLEGVAQVKILYAEQEKTLHGMLFPGFVIASTEANDTSVYLISDFKVVPGKNVRLTLTGLLATPEPPYQSKLSVVVHDSGDYNRLLCACRRAFRCRLAKE